MIAQMLGFHVSNEFKHLSSPSQGNVQCFFSSIFRLIFTVFPPAPQCRQCFSFGASTKRLTPPRCCIGEGEG